MPAKDRTLSFIARISILNVEGRSGLLVLGPETKPAALDPTAAQPKGTSEPVSVEQTGEPKKKKEKSKAKVKAAEAEKPEKKKRKKAEVSTPAKAPPRKARIEGRLEPHEHESLATIARMLTGEQDIASIANENEPVVEPETAAPPSSEIPILSITDDNERELLRADLKDALNDLEALETQNRALQNELHAARVMTAELQTILDTATDGIFILDSEGHILNMNRPAEALFGLGLEALDGENIIDLFASEAQERALIYIQNFVQNGDARVMNGGCEVTGIEKNGGAIPLFLTLGALGGEVQGAMYCAVLRDITQWKQAEAELIAAKKRAETASGQKTDFLAKISHEIRTPLNAIIGFSEVMLEERFGAIDNERYKQYLNDIHNSGGHLLSLVNDLLDLSKIESGKLDLAFAPVQVNDIVLQAVGLLQPQANRRGVILRSSLQPLPPVAADARSIKQVLLNLLSNAVRFTPEGGQIIVATSFNTDWGVTLRVRDTGIGMTHDEIALALEPFRQIKTDDEQKRGEGTGLGLPISKALVEANHALFEIQSEPSKGTQVSVTFPKARVLDEPF